MGFISPRPCLSHSVLELSFLLCGVLAALMGKVVVMVVVLSVPLGSFPHNFSSIKGEDGKTTKVPIDGEGIRRKALISLICWMRAPVKRFDGTFDYSDKKVYLKDMGICLVKDGPYLRTHAELSTFDDAFDNALIRVMPDDRLVLTHKGKTWDYFKAQDEAEKLAKENQ